MDFKVYTQAKIDELLSGKQATGNYALKTELPAHKYTITEDATSGVITISEN